MTPFEYVIVLISIILGLGITLVLTGMAELIRKWQVVRVFWPYLIWIGLVFVLHVHEWWVTYELKSITVWSLPTFLFVVLYPILLFVLANLLFPSKWKKDVVDLKAYYFKTYPKFFFIAILLDVLAVSQNITLSGYTLKDQFVHMIILITLSILLIRKTERVIVHAIVAIVLLIMMLASLIVTSDSLLVQ
jgi:hypothetical protein